MEGEKNNQVLRGELRDQEELVHRMMSLETENNALSTELGQVILLCFQMQNNYSEFEHITNALHIHTTFKYYI